MVRLRRPFSGPMRVAIGAAVLVDLAVLGADVFLLSGVSSTTVVALDDALVDYRASIDPTTTAVPAPASAGAWAEPVPSAAVATPVAAAGPAPPVSATASSDAITSGAPDAAPAFAPPAPGVYRYRTSGGESISVLGAHHDYPAETYAVVRATGGCGWQIRSEVVREHVDERQMCSDGSQLLQVAQTRQVEFFGTRDGGGFVCDPPQVQHAVGDAPGAVWAGDCGDDRGADGHLVRTTVGTGRMTIDGVTVDVIRFRIDGTLTGRVRGTSVDLMTVVASTGLPVVWDRTVDTVADAFGASVRYQEQARFELVSLTPTT
jgi:hypothetical protein